MTNILERMRNEKKKKRIELKNASLLETKLVHYKKRLVLNVKRKRLYSQSQFILNDPTFN